MAVANAYVEFAKEWQSIDGRSVLGVDYVGVVVCEVLQDGSSLKPRTLCRWPIRNTLFEGVSLFYQECQYNQQMSINVARIGARLGWRKYSSSRHVREGGRKKRKDTLIEEMSITETLSGTCCKSECLSQFNTTLVETLRYEMHHSDTKFKDGIKLGVHRNFHYRPGTSSKICIVEGRAVCMQAWRMIFGVSKTDFYRYQKYAALGRRPQYHGGKGKKKTSISAAQAIQTMSMILSSKADSMPNRSHTKKSGLLKGKKVVEKILPSGTKWKHILDEVNKVKYHHMPLQFFFTLK